MRERTIGNVRLARETYSNVTTGNRQVRDHCTERNHDGVADGTCCVAKSLKAIVQRCAYRHRCSASRNSKLTHRGVTEQETQRSTILERVGSSQLGEGKRNIELGYCPVVREANVIPIRTNNPVPMTPPIEIIAMCPKSPRKDTFS